MQYSFFHLIITKEHAKKKKKAQRQRIHRQDLTLNSGNTRACAAFQTTQNLDFFHLLLENNMWKVTRTVNSGQIDQPCPQLVLPFDFISKTSKFNKLRLSV